MIPTEIITFTVSTAIGAWIKLKNKQLEAQRHQADLWARQAGAIIDDRTRARDFMPPGGPLTRRLIVVSVLFAVFIAPFVLAAFFPQTPVFYAYAEKTRGFFFIFESLDRMQFQELKGYVILPVHTQTCAPKPTLKAMSQAPLAVLFLPPPPLASRSTTLKGLRVG